MSETRSRSLPPSLRRLLVTAGEAFGALIGVSLAGVIVGACSYLILQAVFGYTSQAALLVGTLLGGAVMILIPVVKAWMVLIIVAGGFWVHAIETLDTRQQAVTHTANTFAACGAAGFAILLPIFTLSHPWDIIGAALVLIGVIFLTPVLLRLLKIARPLTEQEQDALLSGDADSVATDAIYIATPMLPTVNGVATGIGPLQRIFLNETAVEELPGEHLEVMVYHELGHLTLGHVRHQFLYAVVVILTALGLTILIAGSASVWGVLMMAVGAVSAVPYRRIQRRHEHEADAFAMRQVEQSDQAVEALAALRDLNGSTESETATGDRLQRLLSTHPSFEERIAHLETLRE